MHILYILQTSAFLPPRNNFIFISREQHKYAFDITFFEQ